MSILMRAALLGGLAYVVSRAVRSEHGSERLTQLRRTLSGDQPQDDIWPTSDHQSTGKI